MEEHLCSFLASKDDAIKNLQSIVQKIAEIHKSTITAAMEFSGTLHRTAIEDLEYINTSISYQTADFEKLLDSLIVEANDVTMNIQSCLSKQTELLVYSVQQQEQGLQRILNSAQSITTATLGFFDEICSHASELISNLEESQTRNHNYITNFEKMFEEQSVKEEQQAIEKIVSALVTLRTNKTALVSQALRNIDETGMKNSKAFQQNLSKVQETSVIAKNSLNRHMENVEGHFLTDLYLLTEFDGSMKDHINQCTYHVNNSREHWKRAAHSMKKLNDDGNLRIQSTIRNCQFFDGERTHQNEIKESQFITTSSVKSAEFDANVSNLLFKLKDTYLLDSQTKDKMDFLSNQCLNQLDFMKTEHKNGLSTIQNEMEVCLVKDYKVNEQAVPEPRVLEIPSLASIEEMRTQLQAGIKGEEISEFWAKTMQPIHEATDGQNRAPFLSINGVSFVCK